MDQQSKNIMSSEGNAPNRSYTTNTSGKERQVDDYTGNDQGKNKKNKKANKKLIIGGIVVAVAVVIFIVILLFSTISKTIKMIQLRNASVGSTITFGKYEQDGFTVNGKEDIEWIVLDKQDDKILVISNYGLDCKCYNDIYDEVSWRECSLRKWLINDFMVEAFSEEEANMIPTVDVACIGYSGTKYTVKDKVFILSREEILSYGEEKFETTATDYAKNNGAFVAGTGHCNYWARSAAGSQADWFQEVDFFIHPFDVNCGDNSVRPAMWISI